MPVIAEMLILNTNELTKECIWDLDFRSLLYMNPDEQRLLKIFVALFLPLE